MAFIAIICLVLAGRAACRNSDLARPAAALLTCGGITCFMGIMPLCFTNEYMLRVTDVVYFMGLDMATASMVWYAGTLAGVKKKTGRTLAVVIAILLVLDFFNFVFNIFNPVVIGHEAAYHAGFGITMDFAIPQPPSSRFIFHMLFDYVMVVIAAVYFVTKIVRTPRVYRSPYINTMVVLSVVFMGNVAFVFTDINLPLDYSSVAYALGIIYIYWMSFHNIYDMQHAQVIKLVSNGARYPIISFDAAGKLIALNIKARELFQLQEDDWNPVDIAAFADRYGIPVLKDATCSCEFVWRSEGDELCIYGCEYTVVRDEQDRCLGSNLTMHNVAETVDTNTGFYNEDGFREKRAKVESQGSYPLVVASIGLSHVAAMNELHGRSATDESIRNFAHELRRIFPDDSICYLAYRGSSDFVLLTGELSKPLVEARLEKLKSTIKWGLPDDVTGDFEFGVIVATGEELSVTEACHRAYELVNLKRFASTTSPRSNTVASLTRPLIDRGFSSDERLMLTSAMAGDIARRMNVDEITVYRAILCARLRDVGKVSIPDDIVFHNGPYTRGARLLMERHVEVGYRLVKATEGLSSLADAVLHHHERWDGGGYPDSLAGENIPIESRILSVAVSYDAMVHPRSFLPVLTPEEAAKEIASYAGSQYDPDVVAAFLDVMSESGMKSGGTPFVAQREALGKTLRESVEEELAARESGRMHALVVDDNEINRGVLALQIQEKFDVTEAAGGQEAIDLLKANHRFYDIVLLDLIMPDVDGHAVLNWMKEDGIIGSLPVIVVTVETDPDVLSRCLDQGAAEFLAKGTDPGIVLRRSVNAVELYANRKNLQQRVEEQAADIILKNDVLRTQANQLARASQQVSSVLYNTIEYRDCDSAGHLDRVMGYAMSIAKMVVEELPGYGLTEEQVLPLGRAAALHDIGKVAIPDNILFKAGRLTDEEFAVMKSHTVSGYNLIIGPLSDLDDDFARFSLQVVRSHHERWNGGGYPDGLVGRQIPIAAQIAALADVYDALTSDRPYKDAYSHEKAVEMILGGECGAFEESLLKIFETAAEGFPAMFDKSGAGKKTDPVEEYRQALLQHAGLEDGAELDNSASLENIIQQLMDSNRSLMLANRYDMATGALNHNYYLEYLRNFNSTSVCCMAAVYFDVNGLHEYNRDYGHAQGDAMLANVAETIIEVFQGCPVFRPGGDEFVAICESLPEDQVLALIEKVKERFDERGLSCSVGYDWRNTDIDMEKMVRSADRSMFKQKSVFYGGEPGDARKTR